MFAPQILPRYDDVVQLRRIEFPDAGQRRLPATSLLTSAVRRNKVGVCVP